MELDRSNFYWLNKLGNVYIDKNYRVIITEPPRTGLLDRELR